MPLSDRHALTV